MGADERSVADDDEGAEKPEGRATLPLLPRAASTGPRNETPSLPMQACCTGPARATLTVMSGSNAGRLVAIGSEPMIIGREGDADLCLDDPGVSRKHARVARRGQCDFYIEDLGSRNGTFIRGRRSTRAPLESGDYVQVGVSGLLRFAITDAADEALQRQLYESAVRDGLTRVFNRRYFSARLVVELAHARRVGGPLALLMLDIDCFKTFNDTFGHIAGDGALTSIAARVERAIAIDDLLARYGGEEFVILSSCVDHEGAIVLADRVRSSIEQMSSSIADGAALTVSIGVASLSELEMSDSGTTLLERADKRLYEAKAGGRNRVCAS